MENQVLRSSYREINAGIVFKQWSPLSTVSSLPERSLMSTTKKAYSEIFSTSKRTGKNLWELLSPILPDYSNKESRQALDIAIYQWLLTNPLKNTSPINKVPFITGMQFNDEFTLEEMGNIAFEITRKNDNSLGITSGEFNPVKDIPAPLKTEAFSFKIMAVSCDVAEGIKTGCYITELLMPYSDMQILSQNIHLPLNSAPGNLIVIAMAVEYSVCRDATLQIVHNRRWLPSGIVWAGYN